MADQLLYSTTEAASRLGIGKTKLFELISSGDLSSIQIGSSRLVADRDIEDFVARLRSKAADADRVQALLAIVDGQGRLDVCRIPRGTTLADLEAAKIAVSNRLAAA